MLNQLGRCKRCGRPLKDLQSIQLGYGPKCWELEQQVEQQPNLFDYENQKPTEYEAYIALVNRLIEKKWNKVLVR